MNAPEVSKDFDCRGQYRCPADDSEAGEE